MQNNIRKNGISKKCILCGNCAAVCPRNAITYDNIKEKVIINNNLCIHCGLCIKNCPTIIKKHVNNSLLGNVNNVYVGFSNSPEVRFKSASGGLLTETLKYLIENRIVDRVLITDFSKDKMQAESYFTDNIDNIVNSSGSKYQIVNINKSLKDVLNNNLKYAYVGLPCHHIGLEKFIEENPKIKNRIAYKFAICCSHNCNISILDYVAYSLKIKKEDIASIKYRGDGWPEYLTVRLITGEKIKFPKKLWNDLFLSFFYTPKQCINCNDFCGENADVSFADAWLAEYTSQDSAGYNLVFSHNSKGEELLQTIQQLNIITLKKHCYNDIIKSQIIGLFYKKFLYSSYNITDIMLKMILKFNSKISKNPLFKLVNSRILKYYCYIISVVFINKKINKYRELLLNENSNC